MKLKEILKSLSTTLNISEFGNIEGDLNNIDIADAVIVPKLQAVTTLDGAKNNSALDEYFKERHKSILRGEMLGPVDASIYATARQLFGEDKVKELEKLEFTKERIAKFNEFAVESLSKRMSDTEKQTLLKQYQDQITALTQAKEKEVMDVKSLMTKQAQDFENSLIRNKVMEMANAYNWAKPYQDQEVKKVLVDTVYNKIQQKAVMKLNKDTGNIELWDKAKPDLMLYEGGKKIEIKDLMEPEITKFTEKTPPGNRRDVTSTQNKPFTEGKINPYLSDIIAHRDEYMTK
jgi:hypothetical protein